MNLRTRISRLEQATKPCDGSQLRQFPDECICYPDLQYGLSLKEGELRAAEELPCPLHGNRIPDPRKIVYKANWAHDHETLADWETTVPGSGPILSLRALFLPHGFYQGGYQAIA